MEENHFQVLATEVKASLELLSLKIDDIDYQPRGEVSL